MFDEFANKKEVKRVNDMLTPRSLSAAERVERSNDIEDAARDVLRRKYEAGLAHRGDLQSMRGFKQRQLDDGAIRSPVTDAEDASLAREIENCTIDLAKNRAALKNREPQLSLQRIYNDLSSLPRGVRLKDTVLCDPVLDKPRNYKQLVAGSRATTAALESLKARIERARVPQNDARAHFIAEVKRDNAKTKIDFSKHTVPTRRARNSSLVLGDTILPVQSFETGMTVISINDGAAIFKLLFEKEFIRFGCDEIAKEYENDPLVIPITERAARRAEIEEKILAECRRENRLIELAEDEGLMIPRRPDAPTFAVLGIEIDDSPVVAAIEDVDFG